MTAHARLELPAASLAINRWREHLAALSVVAAATLLLFARDAADMVRIWFESATFNHCAAILPIVAWLVWQRVPELRQLAPRAWWPGLLLTGAGALGWLLGEAGGVALARHAGLVLMLQGAVVAILGMAVARGLAFPIFYALFLIPTGEEIVPLMQTITARMCMGLLGLVGVPAHLEGVFITTPAGYFEVAEACSGIEFLVAMLAFGALVANLCFTSWRRRLAFMAASIAIPVLANGVRAFATIWIAGFVGIDFAAGFDHVVFGWFFFAFVMAVTMAVGWRFFDRRPGDPWFDPETLQSDGPVMPSSRLVTIAAAAVALAAAPVAWSVTIVAGGISEVRQHFRLPEVPGWTQVAASRGRAWQPHFAGADILRTSRYRDAEGREVDLVIAVFARQSEGREIVGFGQGAAPAWAWAGSGSAPPNGRADRIVSFGVSRDVVTFYRVGRILTGSDVGVKLETMKMRLTGGTQRAVALLVSAPAPADGISPRPAIDAFLRALGPIDTLADRAAGKGA